MKGSAKRRETIVIDDESMDSFSHDKRRLTMIDPHPEDETVFPRRSPTKYHRLNPNLPVSNYDSEYLPIDFADKEYYRNSFHESDRTDSGFGGENGSSWRLTQSYHLLSHPTLHASMDHPDELRTSLELTEIDSLSTEDLLRNARLEKTGWLEIKHWLTVQHSDKLELASKRQWKRFWVNLKGTNLQCFNSSSDTQPKLTLNIMDSLCYPSPEYLHRQHVFTLTLSTGDIYCIQTTDQTDLDQWIRSIHDQLLLRRCDRVLTVQIEQLTEKIRRENQIIKLAQLQLSVITSEKTRSLIRKEIELWENNLENFHMDLFRFKCYFAASSYYRSLPNPHDLLAHTSSRTKTHLSKLLAFTPCGIYAWTVAKQRRNNDQTLNKMKKTVSSAPLTPQMMTITVINESNFNVGTTVTIENKATVEDLLQEIADQLNLSIDDYFLYFNSITNKPFLANKTDQLDTLTYSSVYLRRKLIYQIVLDRSFHCSGIDINYEHPSKALISHVMNGSEGERLGVRKDDEVIIIQKSRVKDLDLQIFNEYLNQIPLMFIMRSSRLTSERLNVLSPTELIMAQNRTQESSPTKTKPKMDFSCSVTKILTPNKQEPQPMIKTLSNAERLRKTIEELIETEKSYVHDLECLLTQYIEALKKNGTILPSDTIEPLYVNLQAIYQFHSWFYQRLQSVPLVSESCLPTIADIFISSVKSFKLYSTYCALHLRMNRLLDLQQNDNDLKVFLSTCNPCQQHASSFQSYLIKPVQRIVKYPLFLQQIYTCSKTENSHQGLTVKRAMKIMIKTSKFINSMQKLYEEFGPSFESLCQQYYQEHNQMLQLNLPDLYAYGEIEWINIDAFLHEKHRRRSSYQIFCFVFVNGCLLLVRERSNSKTQDETKHDKTKKSAIDRFLRFFPNEEINVELLHPTDQNMPTWQLIQTDPKTSLKSYFHFANEDAQVYVKTIKKCLSKANKRQHEQTMKVSHEFTSSLSRSGAIIVSTHMRSTSHSAKSLAQYYRRSPSPVWKRRGTTVRQRASSVKTKKNLH